METRHEVPLSVGYGILRGPVSSIGAAFGAGHARSEEQRWGQTMEQGRSRWTNSIEKSQDSQRRLGHLTVGVPGAVGAPGAVMACGGI
jgi:hypothetical protein